MDNVEKLSGKTFDIISDNIKKLEELFPELCTEGKVDIDKLSILFDKSNNKAHGEYNDGDERYEFTWKGKKEALRLAQKQTSGTLRPCKEESINFDETKNLYIEGDNLEVLRALQSSYRGRIKIIYIDPPYNTGKDFIYKDNFIDNVLNYKESMDESYKTNTDNSGRLHTNWLNMIYPRLKLAKNLLRDDGVIFISIDDNEVDNLRKVCNEIFGENNSVGTITWEKRTKAQNTNDAKTMFQSKTEYILMYKKNISKIRFNLEVSGSKEYTEKDERGVFRYKALEEMSSLGMRGRESMIFSVLGIMPGENKQWKFGIDTINKYIERKDLVLRNNWPYFKIRPIDEDAKSYFPFWSHFFDKDAYGTAELGKAELSDILSTKSHGFETVKPLNLIKKLIFHVKDMEKCSGDDIILDFFSGSATTAHAVMSLNADDQKSRKYIMVQIPEEIDEKSEAYKEGYSTICDIGKERIRRAGQKIIEENREKEGIEDLDIGFKVFKLDTTNLRTWDDTLQDTEEIKQMALSLENPIKDGRTQKDVVYEILLKYGVDLTKPIEELDIMGSKVYSVGLGNLMICLEENINLDLIDAIAEQKPNRVVLYDNGLDNESKINGEKILKSYGIQDIRTI